jgi:DNA-binding Lrp family transcriptional regulator
MDAPYSPLEFSLLNDWQRDFPLCPHPFAEIGTRVGAGATAVIDTLQRLQRRGAISRLGAVFAPRRAGAGTLAALAAPPERLEEIAAMVSARPEVNHNYQREHHWNLWFVVTTRDRQTLAATLAAIEAETGCKVLSMVLKHEYHIDLGFNLKTADNSGADKWVASPHRTVHAGTDRPVGEIERTPEALRLLEALESGLALVPRPYEELGRRCRLSEAQVMGSITGWQNEGLIKRFGVVVRHHEVGYRANAMVVFDIPDDEVDAIGERLAQESAVTLCYRRERSLPDWSNNLYCMVHGKSREEVAPVIDRLTELAAVTPSVLFSVRRFKQCGARYFAGMST